MGRSNGLDLTAPAMLRPVHRSASLVLAAALALGCAPPPRVLLEPDAARGAALGDDGPFGVTLHERTFRVRIDDAVDADVLVPTVEGGRAAPRRPVVVFLHGGFVGRERYRALTAHLASRGAFVIAPGHLLDLPFFEEGNGLDVLQTLRRITQRAGDPLEGATDDGPVLVIGHSLGGVIGASLFGAAPDAVSHLALLASYPASSDFSSRPPRPGRVLSIAGGADSQVSLERATEGARALATSGVRVDLAVVDGMSHMQFADGAGDAETPAIDDATALARTRVMLDALLEEFFGRESVLLDEPARWPEGVRRVAVP